MIDINNFAEGTTFEYEGKTVEIHYDVRSLLGIKLETMDCCELCYFKGRGYFKGMEYFGCSVFCNIIHGEDRDPCSTTNNQGFRFYYRLKETDNVESDGQDASSKDRVD